MILSPSPNHDARPAGARIDHLVLHYTGMLDAASALARLCDPLAKVSSHYLVDEDGTVYRMVAEEGRAWHAGISFWRGARQLNDRSIGIEIVNPGLEWGYRAYPAAQMATVQELCLAILARHEIPARNVVGHSDIAPDRKQDPGALFDWRGLAARGVGIWTEDFARPGQVQVDLAAIGYDMDLSLEAVVAAFQRHFLADQVTGIADGRTAARAAAVRAMVDGEAAKGAGSRHPDGWTAAAIGESRRQRKVRAPREYGAG